MTTDQDKHAHARLREIMQDARKPNPDLAALLTEAIPLLHDYLNPYEIQALQQDLYGFKNQTGIDYYTKPPVQKYERGYIPYRAMIGCERPGRLIVINPDGTQKDVEHELAKRGEYFIGLPVGRLQELVRTAGDTVVVELPDLTEYIGQQEGGTIATIVEKKHLEQMIDNTARGLEALIDLAITPGRREALEAKLKKEH